MPHVKELESITHFGAFNAAVDATWFPNTLASSFWTGSPYAGVATNAWFVPFYYGNAFIGDRSIGSRVRLVRAGQ